MFAFLLEIITSLILFLYYIIESILINFIPVRFRSKDVSGQIVLITGAGGDIGRLLALKLAALRCKVVCWDVAKQANDETVRMIKQANGEAYAHQVDLTKKEDVYRMAERVKNEIGHVNILVNNAGVLMGKQMLDCKDEQIKLTFDVNTLALFWTTKCFLPDMIKQKSGHIVTMASMGGLSGLNNLVDYCSSKHAAVGFDDALRSELIKNGCSYINTSVICPIFVKTRMVTGVQSLFPPLLEPEFVAQRSVDAILTNQAVCLLPGYMAFYFFLKSMIPVKARQILDSLLRVNNALDAFEGNKNE